MNNKIRAYAELLGFAGLIIALDQYTKWLVRVNLDYGETWAPWDWLMPYARFFHVQNTGAAFGMFQNGNLVFMILAIIVSVVILYYFPQMMREDWPVRVALILQFAGAVGNLIDRLTQGYVTDFISVGNFFVFNVADSSISIGVAVLILGMLVKEIQERRQAGSPSGGDDSSQSLDAAQEIMMDEDAEQSNKIQLGDELKAPQIRDSDEPGKLNV